MYLSLAVFALISVVQVKSQCALTEALECPCDSTATCSGLQGDLDDVVVAQPFVASLLGSESIVCDAGTSKCTLSCNGDATVCGSAGNFIGASSATCEVSTVKETDTSVAAPSNVCTIPPTDAPVPSPTDAPTPPTTQAPSQPPVKEPTDNPNPPTTAAPTKRPFPSPTETPVAPLPPCDLDTADIIGSILGCQCTDDNSVNCDGIQTKVENHGQAGPIFAQMFAGESVSCDSSTPGAAVGHCSLSCNTASTCTTAGAAAASYLNGDTLECNGDANNPVCQLVAPQPNDDPTAAPVAETPSPTPTACKDQPAFPTPPQCNDEDDLEGCRVSVWLKAQVCNLDVHINQGKLRKIIRESLKWLFDELEGTDWLCAIDGYRVQDLTTKLLNAAEDIREQAEDRASGGFNTDDGCPTLDTDLCAEDEFTVEVDTTITVYCGTCAELYASLAAIKAAIKDGTFFQKLEAKALEFSELEDIACGRGFGGITVQSPITVGVRDENDNEFEIEVDVERSGGAYQSYMGAVVAVMFVLSFLY